MVTAEWTINFFILFPVPVLLRRDMERASLWCSFKVNPSQSKMKRKGKWKMFQWYLLSHTMKESIWYINNFSISFRKVFPEYLWYIFSKHFSRLTRKTALLSRLRNLSKWVDPQYPKIEINQKARTCSKCPLQTRKNLLLVPETCEKLTSAIEEANI